MTLSPALICAVPDKLLHVIDNGCQTWGTSCSTTATKLAAKKVSAETRMDELAMEMSVEFFGSSSALSQV